jgi:MFS family permease
MMVDAIPSAIKARPLAALSPMRQMLLALYWFSLSFHAGALLGLAVPAQLSSLANSDRATILLAVLGGIGGFISMIAQPIAGALSDLSAHAWGRRRPYLVGGAALDTAGLVIMTWTQSLSMLFAGYLLASFGNAVSGAAYQAYIPDHVPPEQYGESSGYLGAMSMLGTIVSFGVAAVLVSPQHVAGFYVITAVLIAGGAVLTAVAIADRPGQTVPRPVVQSWRALWIAPWRNPDFSWVFATRALMMLALYTLFTFVAFYARDVVHMTEFVQGAAILAGVATVASLASGIVAGVLSDRVGRKPLVSIAGVLMSSSLLGLAFFHQVNAVLSLGAVFGLALGIYMAVDWALAVDVLPDESFAAKDLGLWGLSTTLPQTAAPFVGGAVLAVLHPAGPVVAYGVLFAAAAVCAALSGVLVWQIRDTL